MQEVIDYILKADRLQIKELLDAVLKRYAQLYPDWEVCTISLEKTISHNEQLDRMIELLQNMKKTGL